MELYKWKKIHFLTFKIEYSSKFLGMELHLALLKDNLSGDRQYFFFFFSKISNDSPWNKNKKIRF